MTIRKFGLIASASVLLVLGATSGDAAAQSATPNKETTIGGWSVTLRPAANGICSAAREYKDPDDGNKQNAVAFLMRSDKPDTIIVSLGYEGWTWDKDEKTTADFKVDKTVIIKQAAWTSGAKTGLVGVFDGSDAFMNKVSGGQKAFLIFGKNSEANFLIPNAGLALGALKLCSAQT